MEVFKKVKLSSSSLPEESEVPNREEMVQRLEQIVDKDK